MLRDAARPWAEHDLAGEVKNSRGENQGITASEHAGAWDRQLSVLPAARTVVYKVGRQ
jgi:hypothetical protein